MVTAERTAELRALTAQAAPGPASAIRAAWDNIKPLLWAKA